MKKIFIYSVVVALLAWIGGFFVFVEHINSYKIDTQTKTDAIIVLTGGKNRIAEGIKLLNENMSDKLFISGVPSKISIEDIEKQAKIVADDKGKITLGRKATNTIENASETTEWMHLNNIKSIRLITSSYHIPRSLQEFIIYQTNSNNFEVVLNPIYSPNLNKKWWKSWGTFKILLTEYNKFLVVYVCRRLHIY